MTSATLAPVVTRAGYIPAQYRFSSLITPVGYNPKLDKGRARGYGAAAMYLAPKDLSGYDVCQYASLGCAQACLNTAGHGGIVKRGSTLAANSVQKARVARTLTMFLDGFNFNVKLVKAIESHIRRSEKNGLTPVVRLNGTSDLPWEKRRLNDGRTVLETFPTIQFYDYTKHAKRALANARGEHPANYHLTFSRSETNEAECLEVLAAGGNVAAVFLFCMCKRPCKHELPEGLSYLGREVISGDHDDLRFLDPAGVVVGLKAKGKARTDTSGFVVDLTATPVLAMAA